MSSSRTFATLAATTVFAVAVFWVAGPVLLAQEGSVTASTNRGLTFGAHCPPCPSSPAAVEVYAGTGELLERVPCLCETAPTPSEPKPPGIVSQTFAEAFVGAVEPACTMPAVGPRPAPPHERCPVQVHRFSWRPGAGRYVAARVEGTWTPPTGGRCRSVAGEAKCGVAWATVSGSNREMLGYLMIDGRSWVLRWGGWSFDGQGGKAKLEGGGLPRGEAVRFEITSFFGARGGEIHMRFLKPETGEQIGATVVGKPDACVGGARTCYPDALELKAGDEVTVDSGFDGFHPGEGVGGRLDGLEISLLHDAG